MRSKLRLKSERRVGVHAIGEVATAFALEFESQGSGVGEQAGKVLEDVALMLEEKSKMRLSVEGHADEVMIVIVIVIVVVVEIVIIVIVVVK